MARSEKAANGGARLRQGSNPYKGGLEPAYTPKDVTVAILAFIPHLSGYFESKFDILKITLASILKNTEVPFDLLVFDNGSCQEVVNYLMDLKKRGVIQYLILSANNLGTLGAYNVIFSAAPGRYVAYSDDDILFHPGWLSAQLRIFQGFPGTGMVSGLPTWHQFGRHNKSTMAMTHADSSITVRRSKEWPMEWAQLYAESTGRPLEVYLRDCADAEVVMLEHEGVRAYASCTHCQFVVLESAVASILPLETEGKAIPDMERLFDERLDEAGCVRLSTVKPYVEHMGNVLSPRIQELVGRYGLFEDSIVTDRQWSPYAPPRLLQPILRWVLHWSLPYKVLYRAYHELFELVSWKTQEDKQRLARTLKTRK